MSPRRRGPDRPTSRGGGRADGSRTASQQARRPGGGPASRTRTKGDGATTSRRPSSRQDTSARPSVSTTGSTRGSTGARPSVTGRAAVLALVLAVLMVSFAYPLRIWYDQHTERAELEAERAELEASVEHLERELQRWVDPAYVRAVARERLGYVMPGEQAYVVPDTEQRNDESEVIIDSNGLAPEEDGTWYERLWGSMHAADEHSGPNGQ